MQEREGLVCTVVGPRGSSVLSSDVWRESTEFPPWTLGPKAPNNWPFLGFVCPLAAGQSSATWNLSSISDPLP